jgi:hypothetical protein
MSLSKIDSIRDYLNTTRQLVEVMKTQQHNLALNGYEQMLMRNFINIHEKLSQQVQQMEKSKESGG